MRVPNLRTAHKRRFEGPLNFMEDVIPWEKQKVTALESQAHSTCSSHAMTHKVQTHSKMKSFVQHNHMHFIALASFALAIQSTPCYWRAQD